MKKWFVLLVALLLLPAVLGLELQQHENVSGVQGKSLVVKLAVDNDAIVNATFFASSDGSVLLDGENNISNRSVKLTPYPWSKEVASVKVTFMTPGEHVVTWGFRYNEFSVSSSFVAKVYGNNQSNVSEGLNTTSNLTVNASTNLSVNTTPNATEVVANTTVNETPPVVVPPPVVTPPPLAPEPPSTPASTGSLAPVLPIIGGALLLIAIGVIVFVVWLKKSKKID